MLLLALYDFRSLTWSVVEILVTELGLELSDSIPSLEKIPFVAAAKIGAANADNGARLERRVQRRGSSSFPAPKLWSNLGSRSCPLTYPF